jgi:HD-GYP domain-containing protein (c-di-GMP phosphodiesterase class II)
MKGAPLKMTRSLLASILFSAGALLVFGVSWTNAQVETITLGDLVVAILITGGLILAELFPVNLASQARVTMTSIPLFLLAILLPFPLATAGAGLGLLIPGLKQKQSEHLSYAEIISTSARWVILVFFGRSLQQPVGDVVVKDLFLFLGAITLFWGDILSFAVERAFVNHKNFWPLFSDTVRETWLVECIQYLVAILAALAADQQLLSLLLVILPTFIAYMAFKKASDMRETTLGLLEGMADAVDLRDTNTGGHSRRVADLCTRILNQMNIHGSEAELIITAARFHDIGKIAIADRIIQKPDKLLPEETAEMQQHPVKGADLVKKYPNFGPGRELILYHHERWDGMGYPFHIHGPDIPFGSRIIAVADSFDAMTAERPYRGALSVEETLSILQLGRGTQWDPQVVDALVTALGASIQSGQASFDNPFPPEFN